jgi:hypothetical protein
MRTILFGKPEKLRIPPDEGRFDYVGHLADGTQLMGFITGAFPDDYVIDSGEDGWRKIKRWIAVLHLFDAEGSHLSSQSRVGGYDIEGWDEACEKAHAELRRMLEPLRAKDFRSGEINVRLFSVTLDGVTHGLNYTHHVVPEDDFEGEWVMFEPRDFMFHPSWDSGEYST